LFAALLIVTALFIPFASPNVISSIHDITLPEIRSSALAIESFIEFGGAALAPLLAGVITVNSSLQVAILSICVSAWILGGIFLGWTAYLIPGDIEKLRQQMRLRARLERQTESSEQTPAAQSRPAFLQE
jgi:hypothetical protein